MARSKPRLADGSFTLAVLAAATACGEREERVYGGACSPAGERVYAFTEGTIVSTRTVARSALLEQGFLRDHQACTSRAVDPLTIDKLSALMLAVPVHELPYSSPSPMFLGRSDNLYQNDENIWLYSNKTREVERRAHWHPGVGLWQLDIWGPVQALNHAERADIAKSGAEVAAHIRETSTARTAVSVSGTNMSSSLGLLARTSPTPMTTTGICARRRMRTSTMRRGT